MNVVRMEDIQDVIVALRDQSVIIDADVAEIYGIETSLPWGFIFIKNLEVVAKHPTQIYEASIHGRATHEGSFEAATCSDCHSTGATAHKILTHTHPDSAINHFNIPETCGKCHGTIEQEYWDGIHGQLVKQGETESPVCTASAVPCTTSCWSSRTT